MVANIVIAPETLQDVLQSIREERNPEGVQVDSQWATPLVTIIINKLALKGRRKAIFD
jgi:hypothetical protein